jgi:DNA helicase-2/ATP-dependent DNA helicase PcrA
MLVIVYQRALAAYVSRVLPSLDVEGVPVLTFAGWAERRARAALPTIEAGLTDETPPLSCAPRRTARCCADHRRSTGGLALVPRAHGDGAGGQGPTRPPATSLGRTSGPADARVTALAQWVRDGTLDPATRNALENVGRTLRARTRDVIGEWASLLTDREALGAGFARHAPGVFARAARRHPPLVRRARSPAHGRPQRQDDEKFALDAEDDALLLRIYQRQRGRLPRGGKGVLAYEHLMVDEVQDFSPLELAVLLDATTRSARSRWRATPLRRSRPNTASPAGPSCSTSSASPTSAWSRCA